MNSMSQIAMNFFSPKISNNYIILLLFQMIKCSMPLILVGLINAAINFCQLITLPK